MDDIEVFKKFSERNVVGEIYCGTALSFMKTIPTNSGCIVFLDPPFNLGKKYSNNDKNIDKQHPEKYFKWLNAILDESIRILMPGGALYLYHIPIWAMRLGNYIDNKLDFRHWISISMKNGFVRGKNLYPAHYALLYFTKGEPLYFHRPKIEIQKCKCGRSIKDYGGYKSIIEEKGINLSDFWEDLSPVRHASKKLRIPNQLPIKITDRVVAISGKKNKLLVDPFVGTGTSVISAINAGMKFIACDLIKDNCQIVEDRIEKEILLR